MAKKVLTKINDLIPDDRNANIHSEYGMQQLEKGIRQNGIGRSILISSDNKIIAGNGVTEIAGSIGIDDLDIIDSDGKKIIAVRRTDIKSGTKEFYQMALSDNIIASQNIVIDAEVQNAICEEYDIEEWVSEKVVASQEDNWEGAVPKKEITRLGDLYEIGQHRLLCGTATDADAVKYLMNEELSDMVFTDPPYAVNYEKKTNEILGNGRVASKIKNDNLSVKDIAETIWRPSFKNMYDYAKDDCSFYMTMCQGGDQMMMMMMMGENWQVKHELIWVKSSPVFSMGRLDYDYKHEPIIYGWKNKHNWYGKGEFTKSVWEIPKPSRSELHPTMKPVVLVSNAINNSSKPEDFITDYFLGSGTTMVAAHQLNRMCYGMELDPKYCDVIVARMIKLFQSEETAKSYTIRRNGKELSEKEIQKYVINTLSA